MEQKNQNESLAKAQAKIEEMRAAGWKPVVLNPVDKANANPRSLKLAIRAHCWNCMGQNSDPGVKLRIRDCAILNCALHPHRPWQTVSGVLNEFGLLNPGEIEADQEDLAS